MIYVLHLAKQHGNVLFIASTCSLFVQLKKSDFDSIGDVRQTLHTTNVHDSFCHSRVKFLISSLLLIDIIKSTNIFNQNGNKVDE